LPAGWASGFDGTDLRGKVRHGLHWKLLSLIFGQGTQSLVAILLAHLLLPREFGLAGMALAFAGLGTIFSDVAFSAALIQRRRLTEEDRSTIFWTQLVGGIIWTLVGIALSPLVADFFNQPEVAPLFIATSCSFFLITVGQTQNALLTREMRFRALELRRIAANLCGAAAAVALALAGFGAWAIIAQLLCTYGVSTVLVWLLSPWRPKLVFASESLRSLGSFGAKTFVARLLLYGNLNTDNLLIGRYLGSTALGVYSVAYNVLMLPLSRLTVPLRDVLYPALTRLQDDSRRLGSAWLRANQATAALLVPAVLGLAVVAPDFVHVVLGDRWARAVPVLQLLCLAGIAGSFQSFDEDVYQAHGRPGRFLRVMIFSTAITIGGFILGLHWGIVGVAASFAIARTITLAVNSISLCRLIGLSVLRAFRSYAEVALIAIVMALLVFLIRELLVSAEFPALGRLVLCSFVGMCVYVFMTARVCPLVVSDLRRTLAPSRYDGTR
jgi:O-antigen/teichoic acid export membrane protein